MDPLVHLTVALSFATLFGAAALYKMWALSEWPGIVRNYRLMSDALVGAAAGGLLATEVLTAAALLWPPTQHVGACSAALMLLLFATAISINIRRGRTDIDCGCFGSKLHQVLSTGLVVRNLSLAALVLTLLLPVARRPLSALEIAISITCVLTLAFLYPVVAVVLQARVRADAGGLSDPARPTR
ncbi:MAG: MauE/DoxX family redox-associated membrane protein [Steroidobacteraceae bacterium]